MLLRSLKLLIPGPLYVTFPCLKLVESSFDFYVLEFHNDEAQCLLHLWVLLLDHSFPPGNCALQLWNILNYLVDDSFQFITFVFFFWSFYYSNDEPTCCCCCQVTSVVSDSVRPHRRQPTKPPPVPGILQARTLEWVAYMSYPLILSPSIHFCPSYFVFSEFYPILLFFLLSFPFLSLCFFELFLYMASFPCVMDPISSLFLLKY